MSTSHHPIHILLISSSPSQSSKSFRLAVHLRNRLQQNPECEVSFIDIRDWKLRNLEFVFDDLNNIPEAYQPFAALFFKADAYIIVTPEYNGSYTAELKNMLDHFPRQHKKVYGVASATNGGLGGMRSAQQLMMLTLALFGIVSPYMLITPYVDKKIDENGVLMDPSFEPKIDLFLNEFLWIAKRIKQ